MIKSNDLPTQNKESSQRERNSKSPSENEYTEDRDVVYSDKMEQALERILKNRQKDKLKQKPKNQENPPKSKNIERDEVNKSTNKFRDTPRFSLSPPTIPKRSKSSKKPISDISSKRGQQRALKALIEMHGSSQEPKIITNSIPIIRPKLNSKSHKAVRKHSFWLKGKYGQPRPSKNSKNYHSSHIRDYRRNQQPTSSSKRHKISKMSETELESYINYVDPSELNFQETRARNRFRRAKDAGSQHVEPIPYVSSAYKKITDFSRSGRKKYIKARFDSYLERSDHSVSIQQQRRAYYDSILEMTNHQKNGSRSSSGGQNSHSRSIEYSNKSHGSHRYQESTRKPQKSKNQ